MGSINKHIVVGTVGKDPVIRSTKNGKTVCELSVATNDGDKDIQGNKLTNWHKIICFGKVAEFCGEYIGKGTLVYLEGAVKLNSFTGKEGNKIYMKETICYKLEVLSKSIRNSNPSTYTPSTEIPMQPNEVKDTNDIFGDAAKKEDSGEDLPF